jgi:hypothetical protein
MSQTPPVRSALHLIATVIAVVLRTKEECSFGGMVSSDSMGKPASYPVCHGGGHLLWRSFWMHASFLSGGTRNVASLDAITECHCCPQLNIVQATVVVTGITSQSTLEAGVC